MRIYDICGRMVVAVKTLKGLTFDHIFHVSLTFMCDLTRDILSDNLFISFLCKIMFPLCVCSYMFIFILNCTSLVFILCLFIVL